MKTLKTTLLIIAISITSLTYAQNGDSSENGQSNEQGNTNWKLNGNTAATTDYIGTNNNKDLIFKSNNIEGIRLDQNADAKLFGEVTLDKLKFITPQPEEQFLQIKNDGKVVSLSKSDLLDALYDFPSPCLSDINGNIHSNWTQKLNPVYGILHTGVGASNCNTRVGIGTDNPQARLDVRGSGYFAGNLDVGVASNRVHLGNAGTTLLGSRTGFIGFNAKRFGTQTGIWSTSGDGTNNGGAIIYGDIHGSLRFSTIPSFGGVNSNLTDATVKNNTRLFIHKDGNVGIGTEGVAGYKLSVEGFVRARKVVVNAGQWADYVFASDYKLKPLSEVEKFIQENNHLPEVPSEKDVKENGIDLGKMDAVLLKKIEELTLYILEQEKRILYLENK